MSDLRERLVFMWTQAIAEAYRAGRFINRETLLGEMYRLLHGTGFPPCEVWLSPRLIFPPTKGVIFDQLEVFQLQQWLKHQEPALLLTVEEQVVAIMEVSYSPSEFVDHRPDIRRLLSLSRLGGRSSLHLRLNATKGTIDTSHHYPLAQDLLCAYAVIARKGAMALQRSKLQNNEGELEFPPSFLHLTGTVRQPKAVFSAQVS